MGFDHTEVGGALAHKWKLPVVLEECITYHHNLAGAKLFPRESALIHIANVVAQMAELDSIDPYDVAPVDPIAWEMSGLTEASIESVMHETQAEVAEIEKLFLGE